MINIGFSLIGTPDGFDILNGGVNKTLTLNNKVDFKNRLISISPNSDIYLLFRESINNDIYYHYIYYRYAQEITANRQGSFYGSIVTLQNAKGDPKLIISSLHELANIIKQYCLSTEFKFKTKVSSLPGVPTPKSLIELQSTLQEIVPVFPINNKKAYIQTSKYTFSTEDLFQITNEDPYLNKFDYLYMSDSLEVLQAVENKKVLYIISLKNIRVQEYEIQKNLKQEYDRVVSSYNSLAREIEEERSKNTILNEKFNELNYKMQKINSDIKNPFRKNDRNKNQKKKTAIHKTMELSSIIINEVKTKKGIILRISKRYPMNKRMTILKTIIT